MKKLIGKRIQEIRKKKKITQDSLAELIGVETPSISNIETGKYFPSAENLDKILEILKIEPHELFLCEYNEDSKILIEEMTNSMNKNKKLTELMYKFYLSIKNDF
ncbi:helix-turn-helix transcriptional regulator [bacterium]|nr:helix-turn-helix transcriptional regulator [bacterium]